MQLVVRSCVTLLLCMLGVVGTTSRQVSASSPDPRVVAETVAGGWSLCVCVCLCGSHYRCETNVPDVALSG